LVGMHTGEERVVEVTVGNAWWEPEGLAGVSIKCDVALKELFEWELPEVILSPALSPLGLIFR